MFNYNSDQQSQQFADSVNRMLLDDPSTQSQDVPKQYGSFKDTRSLEQKRRDAFLSFMAAQAPKMNQGIQMAVDNNPQSLQNLGGRSQQQAQYGGVPMPQNPPSPIMFQIMKLLQGVRGQ